MTHAVRTFMTTTRDLLALSDWLPGEGCTHIALEATGVYWKPVWHVLSDGEFTLVLAGAKAKPIRHLQLPRPISGMRASRFSTLVWGFEC